MEEFKHLGVLLENGRKMDQEINRVIDVASAVNLALYRFVVVKKRTESKEQESLFSGQSAFLTSTMVMNNG